LGCIVRTPHWPGSGGRTDLLRQCTTQVRPRCGPGAGNGAGYSSRRRLTITGTPGRTCVASLRCHSADGPASLTRHPRAGLDGRTNPLGYRRLSTDSPRHLINSSSSDIVQCAGRRPLVKTIYSVPNVQQYSPGGSESLGLPLARERAVCTSRSRSAICQKYIQIQHG
jgi:hypothetical protein